MSYTCYTDGSYSSSKNQMGVAIIFLHNGKLILEYSRMYHGGTNNKAELAAVVIALRMVKLPIKELTIVTDSMYVIGGGSLGWKRNKNFKLWEEFDKQYSRVLKICPNVRFKHVKGHQKDDSEDTKWNNKVDFMATNSSNML